jgi:methylated-DNA-[protein]-cysteine S-methyltransferase
VGTSFGEVAPARAGSAFDGSEESPKRLAAVRRQILEYFAGKRRDFELSLAPAGTAFQQRVWAELLLIPYGQTRSYGDLAKRLGQPGASRAVGSANGSNPICLVIPCHRVIATGGGLGGFAFGLEMKRRLLDLERGGEFRLE